MNPTPVSAAEAKQMIDRGERVVFVDARNPLRGARQRSSCRGSQNPR